MVEGELTQDEFLMWLNDRVGNGAHVIITSGKEDEPDRGRFVFTAYGQLHHGSADQAAVSEETRGVYLIGDARIDVTHLPGPAVISSPGGMVGWTPEGMKWLAPGDAATIWIDDNTLLRLYLKYGPDV